jgi:Uma2 family endonuclease
VNHRRVGTPFRSRYRSAGSRHSTQKKDRVTKTRAYGRYGVAFLWLVDPFARILETYALADGQWTVTGLYQDQDEVSAAPFEAVTIALNDLWAGS